MISIWKNKKKMVMLCHEIHIEYLGKPQGYGPRWRQIDKLNMIDWKKELTTYKQNLRRVYK